jgi:hypothetical protein
MSSKTGIDISEIRNGLDSVTLPSLKENFDIAMNNKSNSTISLFSSGKNIAEFFLERGQISEYFNFDTIIDPTFVNILYRENK